MRKSELCAVEFLNKITILYLTIIRIKHIMILQFNPQKNL